MSLHGQPATPPAVQSVRCVPAGTGLTGRSERAEPPSSGMREPAWARTPFQARPGRGPRGPRARLRSGPRCARPLAAPESRATRAADARGGAGAGL